MKNIKTALIIIGVVLGVIVAFSAVALVVTALQYLLWIGIIGLAGAAAYKLLKKPNPSLRLENKSTINELEKAGQTLAEYKKKYLPK
jgi:uncharacterized protein (DUF58 family)